MDYSMRHPALLHLCSNEELATLATKGRSKRAVKAAELLLERHEPLMLKIIGSLGTPKCLYQDAIQAAYVGALKALRRFDPHRGVTFGAFASAYIRGAVRREVYGTIDPPPFFSVADDLDGAEVTVVVRAFVGKLSLRQRYLYQRVFVDDAPRVEVARELGIGPAAVTQAITRILMRGRQELGDLGGDAVA